MARDFVLLAEESLDAGSAPATAAPLTLVFWGNSDNTSEIQCGLFLGDTGGATDYWGLTFGGTDTDLIEFYVNDGSQVNADSASAYLASTWHHAVSVEATSGASRQAGIDGTLGTAETTATVPSGVDAVAIGRFADSTPGFNFSGSICWVAIWNVVLADYQIQMLADGKHPYRVARESLIFFAPCLHDENKDTIGGLALTANPTAATITDGSETGGTVTLTIGAHNLVVGQTIKVDSATPAGYNGTWTISAEAATTVSYVTGTTIDDWTSGGTVSLLPTYSVNPAGLMPSILRSRSRHRFRGAL